MTELFLIPGLPLLAFGLLIFFGRRLGPMSAWVAVGALAGSFGLTLGLADAVFHGSRFTVRWAWLSSSDPTWAVGLAVDGLSWVMLFVVTSIGTLIAIYSIGYMRGDKHFSRFFAYLSLFCASMLGLVMADHFLLLYVCWELVGLGSYLLISFYFEKPAAAAAGRKAFLTTRIGDTGLLVGILLLLWTAGTLRFDQLDSVRGLISGELCTVISLLIFLGAVGKSAQIPLHVWLPDAMEGPTPVSALIHAATMVAAGVYLVARTLPLFTPESLQVVLIIGLATHLLAGTVALTMTDIKRVLAYSTISQLGLMMTALGLGAVALAMFHLVTHAFFKALLFLGAGSVIHATEQQELGRLGGLRRAMPWTAGVFLVAAVSMSGIFPLSGFWSKDAILLAAGHDVPWVMWALLAGAVMTAAYIFRLYLRCFHGALHGVHHPEPRGVRGGAPASPGTHAHESSPLMVVPMVLLAVGAVAVGLAGSPWLHAPLLNLLGAGDVHEGLDLSVLLWSTVAAGIGIWLAWTVGVRSRTVLPALLRPIGRTWTSLAAHTYYVDAMYDRLIVQPVLRLATACSHFDFTVLDGAVNGAGEAGRAVSQWKDRFDRLVVDRIVNGIAQATRGCGAALRWIQTGIIQQYLLVVVIAVIVISAVIRR